MCYEFSNTTTIRNILKDVIEMLRTLDILIGIYFERDMEISLKSHFNGIGSMCILEIDLDFSEWKYMLSSLDFHVPYKIDYSMIQKFKEIFEVIDSLTDKTKKI